MNTDDTRRFMAFLKSAGAWVNLDDDALFVWDYALRSFTPDMCRAGALWFLERNHPREVSPATIKAAVKSLMESGRFQEPMCEDHPEEAARWCRGCAADELTGERPRELRGKRLLTIAPTRPPAELGERVHQITSIATRDERARLRKGRTA